MDETKGFERRLAAAIKRRAGPPQPVDAMAIVDVVTNERPRSSTAAWRPRWRQLFTLAVLVGLTLAAVGGALLFAGSSSPALVAEPAGARPGLIGYAVVDASEQAFSMMHVMEADGTDARPIGPGYCPTWTNDGSVMAFSASARPPSGGLRRPVLRIAAGDGTSPRIVPDIEGGVLSPDGTRVAWLARTNADGQLYRQQDLRIDPISGGPGSVIVPASFSPDERLLSPTWSPDGRRLAFVGLTYVDGGDSYAYRSSIYIVDVDGAEPHRLTARPANDEGQLWWSPDSARLAYTGLPDGVDVSLDYPASDIFVMDVESLNESNMTRSVARETDPRWSPDGSAARVQRLRRRVGWAPFGYARGRTGHDRRRARHWSCRRDVRMVPGWQPARGRIVRHDLAGPRRPGRVADGHRDHGSAGGLRQLATDHPVSRR